MGRSDGFNMAALGLALLSGCAAPPAAVPVCGRPDVLARVADGLREAGRPVVLDAPPVGEVSPPPGPPANPAVTHCAVHAHTTGFDTNRFGSVPIHEPFIVRYTAELRHNGIFVRTD